MKNFLQNLKFSKFSLGIFNANTVDYTRYTLCLLAVLMMSVGEIWGSYRATVTLTSSPAAGGNVTWTTASNSGFSGCTSSTYTNYQRNTGFSTSGSFDFYFYAKANTNYSFIGWSTNESANSGEPGNPLKKNIAGSTSSETFGTGGTFNTYYAIFAKLTANQSSLSFSQKVDAAWGDAKSVSVTYVHVGDLTATITGDHATDFSFSNSSSSQSMTVVSGNTNTEATSTITVYFSPSASGPRTATLTFSGNNEMTKEVTLTGTGESYSQTVSWNAGKVGSAAIVAGTSLDVKDYATSTSDIAEKSAIYYTSSNTNVISVAADGHTLIANEDKIGETATITAHQDADRKYSAATATQVFTVTSKLNPSYVLYINNESQVGTTANMLVGDVIEIRYENAPDLQVSGGSANTFTFVKDAVNQKVTITATGECDGGKLTLLQSEKTTIAEKEVVFTLNISKHETELSSLLDVDAIYAPNNVYDATAYDFVKGTAYNTNNDDVSVEFTTSNENVLKLENGKIVAKGAGTATIHIIQEASNKWTGADVEQTITVKNHEATFTWNVASEYTWNKSISNPYSSDNTVTAITCTSNRKDIADYVDGNVVIYNVSGTATFTLTQAGNDVWAETTKTYDVVVSKVNNHVEFTYTQAMYNDGNITVAKESSNGTAWDGGKLRIGGSSTGITSAPAYDWDDKYVDIKFSGIPSQLTFQIATNANGATGEYWYVKECTNGSDWSGEKWNSEHEGESFSGTQTVNLSPDAQYVRLCYSGNFAGYYKDITITERREVSVVNADVDCGTANHGADATEGTAFLKWYNVKPLTCTLSGTNPEAFELVTTSVNSSLDSYNESEQIRVRALHTVSAGTYTATLNVSNGTQSTSFNLTSTTTKQTPVITWKPELSPMTLGDIVENAATAGSATVHYTVDGTYLQFTEEGAIIAASKTDNEGVDLIAYVVEDDTWKAVSETIKVVVTDLQKQTITWDDKLSFKFTGTKEIDLTATASSGLDVTYSLSGTGTYASLEGNKLTVTGYGNTLYLTATQEGDEEYYQASRTKNIVSRDPSASCGVVALYEDYAETTIGTVGWKEITWDAADGEPGKISFMIKRGTGAAGDMAIEEWYDNNWHRIETYDVSKSYSKKTETISRKATKVRVGAPLGATLYHYVDDVVLEQAKYCEVSTEAIEFGDVTLGTAPTQQFTVHYSNLDKSLDIELETEGTQFSVDKTYIGDDCGEHGTVTITVTYNAVHETENAETNRLIISNSEYTKYVSLSAAVQKASQTITWNPASLELKTTDVVTFDAATTESAAATGIEVTYVVTEGEDVATVTTDGQLCILKAGTVKVTASAAGNEQYGSAAPVEKTFTITKVTPTMTSHPTIPSVALPATLADVIIGNGGAAIDDKEAEVMGSFTWQTPTTVLNEGENICAVVFTPNQPIGKDWYNNVVFNVAVTGNKAVQTITWTREATTTQPCSTPTVFDATASSGLAVSYSTSDASIARVDKVENEYQLVVLTSGTVVITASQAGNGYYSAAEPVSKTITLTRETPVIVTLPTAKPIFVNDELSLSVIEGGEGQVNGVRAEGIFYWKDGTIRSAAGTHKYTACFTPAPAEWYNQTECEVEVTVMKYTPKIEHMLSASDITYGDPLSASTLTGTCTATDTVSIPNEEVEGAYAWRDETEIVNAGTPSKAVVRFTPTKTEWYDVVDFEVAINVAKAEPVLNVTASEIMNVQKLSESVLTNAGTAGTCAWDESLDAENTTYAEGDHANLPYVFTSTDPNYKDGTGVVTLHVKSGYVISGDDWSTAEHWEGGEIPSTADVNVLVTADTATISGNVTVNTLTIAEGSTLVVSEGGSLTITGGESVDRDDHGSLHVEDGGSITITGNQPIVVESLTISASLGGGDEEAASGQLSGEEKLTVSGDVSIEISFDPTGKISFGWYDFVVPFEVNMNGGIARVHSANDAKIYYGVDFVLIEADEVSRANGGKAWRKKTSGVLVPGKLYSISFDDEVVQNTFRFTWNGNGSISNASYDAQFEDATVESAKGWNGMGNGMLRHGHIADTYKIQAYNHERNTYELLAGAKTFAVGTAFFVQATEAGAINWTAESASNDRPLYAPSQSSRSIDEFLVSLRKEGAKKAVDNFYFSASEDATEEYMLGHDLVKMGTVTEAEVAQMWTTKGGNILCDVEQLLVDNKAATTLSFYAPQAEQYTLSVEQAPDDANLYLTYDGNVIWDLTSSPYVLDLAQGTTNGYGLQLETKKAPQITTGVDEMQENGEVVRKVIINNQLYLVTPEGKIYDVMGKSLK